MYDALDARFDGGAVLPRARVARHGVEGAVVVLGDTRDATLLPPRLLFQAVQVNVDAGRMPPPREDGRRCVVTPLNDFRAADEVGSPMKA
ncbi:hypothetical protein WMF30_53165 [Sorangium sp. So ce134]